MPWNFQNKVSQFVWLVTKTIDHDMKDRIFDSMVSVRPESKKKQPHLGMGLHIARMVAEFHGGYIYADNLLEEKGVIFILRIPLI